jgi:hypothetical protein
MFQELMPLLAQRTLIVCMSGVSDNEMRITIFFGVDWSRPKAAGCLIRGATHIAQSP